MKTLFLITALLASTSSAHAGATDVVNVVSCGAGLAGGVAVSAKTLDALHVKSNGVAFVGLMAGGMAGCVGAMELAQPLGRELDAMPEDRDLNQQDEE